MFKLLVIVFGATLVQSCYGFGLFNNYTAEVAQVLQDVVTKYDNQLLDISNADCVVQIKLFLKNLFNSTGDDIWALRMMDATAKWPQSGLLEFNTAWVGQYDECLNIKSKLTDVKGKYCLTTIGIDTDSIVTGSIRSFQEPPQELNEYHEDFKALQSASTYNGDTQLALLPSYGICMPDKCTDVDVQNIMSSIISFIPWNTTCQTKESVNSPLDIGAIVTLVFFGCFISAMILSSMYDLFRRKDSKPHPLLIAFSVCTNGKKLFRVTKNSEEFSSLNGIRVLSTMWVVCLHVFFTMFYGPLTNIIDILKFFRETKSMIIGNAAFSVDTFFLVTGMLVVFNFMKTARRGDKFNIFVFYVHRYLRLTPPIIPVILASIYLTKYITSGPYYPQLDGNIIKPCENNWWAVLLHIQNYACEIKANLCIAQSWYLDVDWQVYVLSPLFLVFLPKRPKIGLSILLCALIGTMLAGFFVTWDKKLQALPTNLYGNIVNYYFKTHTRAGPWVIGGFLGYLFAKIKLEKSTVFLKLPGWFVGLIWITVLAAIPACIFTGHDAFTSYSYRKYSNAFFNTFARPAWSLCIGWIILACEMGYGGIIKTFLSLPVFQVLNRFTYSIYLLHLTMLYMIIYSQKQPGYFSVFNLVYSFFGIFAISFALSIFWVLAFESPSVIIERHFLGNIGKRPKEKKVEPVTNGAEPHPPRAREEA